MAINRTDYQYDESTRPKLSRNVYDYIYTGSNESTSQFASTGGGGGTTINQVGSPFPEISVFTGCTETADGTSGLVPAPVVGDQMKFLQGTGAWIDIPAYRWLHEFPSNSTTKTGLEIDGDFNVTHTISTQSLKVSGAAHFWSLVVDEARASGGTIFVSPAQFEVDYVGEGGTYQVSGTDVQNILTNRPDMNGIFTSNNITSIHTQRAYMRCDDGETRTANECVAGDMLRCKSFNIQAGVYQDVSNKDYWTFVVKTGTGTYNDNGTSVRVFWVDLADYLKNSSNNVINFGSSISYTGEITVDPGQNDNVDLTALKRQAQRTYNGTTSVDTEYGTVNDSLINSILTIYGLASALQSAAGSGTRSISSNVDYTSYDMNQIKSSLNLLMNGDSSLDGTDNDLEALSQLIVDNTISQSEDAAAGTMDDINSLAVRTLGFDYEIPIEIDESESEEITPGGMLREPSAFLPDIEEEEQPVLRAAPLRAGDTSYNWQTDPDYSTWKFGYGTFDLQPGDHLASLGHLYDGDRMGAIVISASPIAIDNEVESPSISQYANINRFGIILSKFRTTTLAKNGNEFTGSFLVNHNGVLMDVNERINMFITDLNTGLTKVGIFLDGENSTIKLVGSVEIRQHDTDDYDTLSVYDSNNNKKVEITPKAIPALSDLSSTITIPANNGLQTNNYNNTYRGTSYITKTEEHSNSILWGAIKWGKFYRYTLKNASHTYTTSCSLGSLVSGDKLTIGSGSFTFRNDMLFNGQNASINRSGQTINSFIMRIKRGTTTAWTVDLKSNFSSYMPSDLASSNITINIPSNMKSQTTISTAGTYSVEFEFSFTFKGVVDDTNNWTNPALNLDSIFVGSFNSMIERSTASNDAFMQIGNNGLAFNMGANRYMYASNSAMKLNWYSNNWSGTNAEGVGISFNDSYGMQIIKNVKTYTPSGTSVTIDNYVDVAIINLSGKTSATITLPRAGSGYYGNGRILEIVTINNSSLNLWGSYNTYQPNWPITISSTSSTVVEKRRIVEVRRNDGENGHISMSGINWDGTFKFISSGTSWYEI